MVIQYLKDRFRWWYSRFKIYKYILLLSWYKKEFINKIFIELQWNDLKLNFNVLQTAEKKLEHYAQDALVKYERTPEDHPKVVFNLIFRIRSLLFFLVSLSKVIAFPIITKGINFQPAKSIERIPQTKPESKINIFSCLQYAEEWKIFWERRYSEVKVN